MNRSGGVPRDPTTRFSDRVADYVLHRPGYPEALFDGLDLAPGAVVADIGAGTGLSSAPFLDRECEVWAVEPNAAMRAAAVQHLGGRRGFRCLGGSAEATTLPDAAVDWVSVAQAFHWFDRSAARAEFRRILRPAGRVVLFWNVRQVVGSEFLVGYEDLLARHALDYREVDHRNVGRAVLEEFFGGAFESRAYRHTQAFDLDGLAGRLRSSSYTPPPDHPGHDAMMAELARLFRRTQHKGTVAMEYVTEAHLGALRG